MPKARMKPFRPDHGYLMAKLGHGGQIYEAGVTYEVTQAEADFLATVPENHQVDADTGRPLTLSYKAFDLWYPEKGEFEPPRLVFGDEKQPPTMVTTETMKRDFVPRDEVQKMVMEAVQRALSGAVPAPEIDAVIPRPLHPDALSDVHEIEPEEPEETPAPPAPSVLPTPTPPQPAAPEDVAAKRSQDLLAAKFGQSKQQVKRQTNK